MLPSSALFAVDSLPLSGVNYLITLDVYALVTPAFGVVTLYFTHWINKLECLSMQETFHPSLIFVKE